MKTHEEIDPTSDFYRICKNCEEEFMTDHRSNVFCDEYCADEYHNRLKREKAANLKAIVIQDIEPTSSPQNLTPPQAPLASVVQPEPIDKAKQDIKFLNSLQIDPECGSHFNMDWMYSQGYDFTAFSGQGKLHNIDPANNSQFIQIGPYRLFRVEYSTVLIKKII